MNPFRMDPESTRSVVVGCMAYVASGLFASWMLFVAIPDLLR